MRGLKSSPYEGGHRVPCFIHWPEDGLNKGIDIPELSAHIDIFPTLIEICKLRTSGSLKLDGLSLFNLMKGDTSKFSNRTIIVDSQRKLHPDKWRLSSVMNRTFRLINGTELYNLSTDPGQKTDISSQYPQLVSELQQKYETWFKDIFDNWEELSYFVVGEKGQDEIMLTSHDWMDPVNTKGINSTRILCYEQPAALWTEALPVGNGRLGGMIYGGTGEEVIKLNENSVWAGGPYNSNGKGGYASLDSIRKLVFDGKGKEAEQLFEKSMMARNWATAPYQPVGNLKIVSPGQSFAENYSRELILDSAICRISYKIGKSRFTRTTFCSYPDQVMVIHMEASDSAAINSLFSLEGVTNPEGTGDEKWGLHSEGNNILILSGVTKSFESSDKRLRYECRMKVIPEGGSMRIIHGNAEMAYYPAIEIKRAHSLTIFVTAASSYVTYNDLSGNPEEKNKKVFDKIGKKIYNEILKDHIADFGSFFNRVSLDLKGENTSAITTDKRFGLFASGKDRNFPALFFQYGRYLLISSSRENGLPAALQGLWNQDVNPAWNGGFTTNINYQMNYWSSDLCNLSECRIPQLKLIKDMHSTGTETSRLNFGSKGWIFNCNTDIWLASAPIYGAYWGAWQGATAWFSNDLWDHFLFTQDTSYLRECELFRHFIEASSIIGQDRELRDAVSGKISQLPPYRIGRYGQLQEWLEDVDNPVDRHRHTSQLWRLYSGISIDPIKTPKIAEASKVVLEHKGYESTGWAMG